MKCKMAAWQLSSASHSPACVIFIIVTEWLPVQLNIPATSALIRSAMPRADAESPPAHVGQNILLIYESLQLDHLQS